ncbi:MAG: HIT family protein [Nanoarchaeota archaeon]|nr:HIT family protein [Nanoarchaeota archaeon]
MSDCIFCKIAHKEIPSHAIDESEEAIAILDIHPLAPGHTMVVPKTHAETILELPDEKTGPVFQLVKEVVKKLKKALSPDGFTLGINHGTNAGQVVPHLHIHIIPRYKGDGGGNIHSIVKNPPKESLEEIKQKILNSKS